MYLQSGLHFLTFFIRCGVEPIEIILQELSFTSNESSSSSSLSLETMSEISFFKFICVDYVDIKSPSRKLKRFEM